jgi:hypothetical protein
MKIEEYDDDVMGDEKDRLLETDPIVIIDYVKTSIEILLSLKAEERGENLVNKSFKKIIPSAFLENTLIAGSKDVLRKAADISWNSNLIEADFDIDHDPSSMVSLVSSKAPAPAEFEEMIQKLEADVRTHIRVLNTYNFLD